MTTPYRERENPRLFQSSGGWISLVNIAGIDCED